MFIPICNCLLVTKSVINTVRLKKKKLLAKSTDSLQSVHFFEINFYEQINWLIANKIKPISGSNLNTFIEHISYLHGGTLYVTFAMSECCNIVALETEYIYLLSKTYPRIVYCGTLFKSERYIQFIDIAWPRIFGFYRKLIVIIYFSIVKKLHAWHN